MNLITGIYILESPVKNPKPDRRCRSWYDNPEFPAGTYKVENTYGSEYEDHYQRITVSLRGRGGYITDKNDSLKYKALEDALVLKKDLVVGDVHDLYGPHFDCYGLALALLVRRGFIEVGLIGTIFEDLGKMTESEIDKLSSEHGVA